MWERAVYSINFTCLSVKFCVCPFFPFGIEGGMWDVVVLIPDHCLSIYFFPFEFEDRMLDLIILILDHCLSI